MTALTPEECADIAAQLAALHGTLKQKRRYLRNTWDQAWLTRTLNVLEKWVGFWMQQEKKRRLHGPR